MNRSKILLGVTTAVLAVVALIAAKSAKYQYKAHGYLPSGPSDNLCTLASNVTGYITYVSGASKLRTSGATVYQYLKAPCANPLYTAHGRQGDGK